MTARSLSSPAPDDALRRLLTEKLADIARLLRDVRRADRAVPQELVHDLRVALRRADATLDLLQARLPDATVHRWRRWLKRLRRKAGRVRDLDVVARLLRRLRDELSPAARRRLNRRWRRRRADACRSLRHAARRSRRRSFARRAHRLAQACLADVPRSDALRASLADSPRWLADAPAALADDERATHALRIRARVLRYRLEDVARLRDAPSPALDRLLALLRDLQDRLGAIQDAAVERRQWNEFAPTENLEPQVARYFARRHGRSTAHARAQAEDLARQAAQLVARLITEETAGRTATASDLRDSL